MVATDIGGLLAELRSVIDQREQLAQQDRDLSRRKTEIEQQLKHWHAETGLDAVKGNGLNVSFKQSMRAKYEPEKWADIVRWAVATGHDYIIQRRLSDAKIEDLALNGTALPDGLTLEGYTDLSTRRI
jgi:hypothetical protein